jgi:hypothetical protein
VAASTPAAAPARVERVTDLTDTGAIWKAARGYLAANARYFENILGQVTRVHELRMPEGASPEVLLHISSVQRNFVNDRVRGKLEEALRAVTGLSLKLQVEFVEAEPPPPGIGGPGSGATLSSAQRVPPEVMEAVKSQPLVQELMKRFDAAVTNVELLGTPDGE